MKINLPLQGTFFTPSDLGGTFALTRKSLSEFSIISMRASRKIHLEFPTNDEFSFFTNFEASRSMSHKPTWIVLSLLVFVAFSFQQNSTAESLSIYAAPQGSLAPNCGSLDQPCAGLEQAVQAANLLQTNLTLANTTIYVLPGEYTLNDTLLVSSPISFRLVRVTPPLFIG